MSLETRQDLQRRSTTTTTTTTTTLTLTLTFTMADLCNDGPPPREQPGAGHNGSAAGTFTATVKAASIHDLGRQS